MKRRSAYQTWFAISTRTSPDSTTSWYSWAAPWMKEFSSMPCTLETLGRFLRSSIVSNKNWPPSTPSLDSTQVIKRSSGSPCTGDAIIFGTSPAFECCSACYRGVRLHEQSASSASNLIFRSEQRDDYLCCGQGATSRRFFLIKFCTKYYDRPIRVSYFAAGITLLVCCTRE